MTIAIISVVGHVIHDMTAIAEFNAQPLIFHVGSEVLNHEISPYSTILAYEYTVEGSGVLRHHHIDILVEEMEMSVDSELVFFYIEYLETQNGKKHNNLCPIIYRPTIFLAKSCFTITEDDVPKSLRVTTEYLKHTFGWYTDTYDVDISIQTPSLDLSQHICPSGFTLTCVAD